MPYIGENSAGRIITFKTGSDCKSSTRHSVSSAVLNSQARKEQGSWDGSNTRQWYETPRRQPVKIMKAPD